MFKKILILSLLAITMFQLSGCASLGLPPGQAKKITGEKNARNQAPGQNK